MPVYFSVEQSMEMTAGWPHQNTLATDIAGKKKAP
jgi:hypothetical protein